MFRPPVFNINQVQLHDWAYRESRVGPGHLIWPGRSFESPGDPADFYLWGLSQYIQAARRDGKPVVFFLGGHVIKDGLSPLLCDLIKRGWITHLAGNGAVAIHDYELATRGETSEDVRQYIKDGRFGLWRDTHQGMMHALMYVHEVKAGIGTALGYWLANDPTVCKPSSSVLAAAYLCEVPCTIHPLIGGDVIAGPEFDGEIVGKMGWRDFLSFTHTISQLHGGGVFCNIGSAVHGPEVYLKALSLARNVATRQCCQITDFVTAVFDLYPLEDRHLQKEPKPSHPDYFFRPLKTILHRTVEDGGASVYVQGEHRRTIPALHDYLIKE